MATRARDGRFEFCSSTRFAFGCSRRVSVPPNYPYCGKIGRIFGRSRHRPSVIILLVRRIRVRDYVPGHTSGSQLIHGGRQTNEPERKHDERFKLVYNRALKKITLLDRLVSAGAGRTRSLILPSVSDCSPAVRCSDRHSTFQRLEEAPNEHKH
ncbi:unnamed protein product [Scytosiphon promiscuus]